MPYRSNELLLVDDSPSDVELTVRALEQDQTTTAVHVVEDGKEALDYVFCRGKYLHRNFSHRPCVILLDLQLPIVTGLQVLKAIKEDERTRAIPIVILTSSKEQKDVAQGYKLGASAFIQKPVDYDQFCKIIRKIGAFWLTANEPPPPEAFSEFS